MEHWDLVLPPSRPDAWQLEVVRRVADQLDRSAPVGVLGSTPEFLDVLSELGFTDIRAFERNLEFYKRMQSLRVQPSNESVVTGDWLETLPTAQGDLHLLLSDLTMGNITYERRADFYMGVRHSLARNGYFIDKVLRHSGPHLKVGDLERFYSLQPLNLATVNRFSSEVLFCSELLDLRDGVVDSSLFYDVLNRRLSAPRLRAFAKRAELITPRDGIWYYGRDWRQLERDYCRELDAVEIIEDVPDSPYRGRAQLRIYQRSR